MKRIIIDCAIKLPAIIALFIQGYSGHNKIYDSIFLFGSGLLFSELFNNIDDFIEKRKAERDQQLIDQIGKD
jgi:hypothetical protein